MKRETLKLSPLEIELVLEALTMLHGFNVADESSAEEMLDQSYETAEKLQYGRARKRNVRHVVEDTDDIEASSDALEDSKAKINAIERLSKKLRQEAAELGEAQKHRSRTPGACAMPRDEHICDRPASHDAMNPTHKCACGEEWPAHADDNGLLTHPADTKKGKGERVRGFQI